MPPCSEPAPPAQPCAHLAALGAAIDPADLRRHVEVLAAPELGGRLTGTEGERAATAYVAAAFRAFGLQPAGDDGYFQPYAFTAGVSLAPPNGGRRARRACRL